MAADRTFEYDVVDGRPVLVDFESSVLSGSKSVKSMTSVNSLGAHMEVC